MKILNKRKLQQIEIYHSSDIDFRNVISLHKKCTAKPHYFLVINTTLASDNSVRFKKHLLERM